MPSAAQTPLSLRSYTINDVDQNQNLTVCEGSTNPEGDERMLCPRFPKNEQRNAAKTNHKHGNDVPRTPLGGSGARNGEGYENEREDYTRYVIPEA
jgi:hypothetical protein